MRIRFGGAGTIPAPKVMKTAGIGGNATCVDLLTNDRQLIILDAAPAFAKLNRVLLREYPQRITGTLLISHPLGSYSRVSVFTPAFTRGNRFVIVGQKRIGQQLENVLAGQVVEPYLPFPYEDLKADLLVKDA